MSPLECKNLPFRTTQRGGEVEGLSERFHSGEIVGFCDDRDFGSLLNILGMIERPASGELSVLGEKVLEMQENEAWQLRDRAFGYLFTHPHLLTTFTVAENVAMPFFRICGKREDLVSERTSEVLMFTGIRHLCGILVGNLDEPTRWLVALARAIVHRPTLLVAISPPSPDLLPLARTLADTEGMAILWSGEKNHLLPFADRILDGGFSPRLAP
jgi:predicted ABC-type transport system involved in lysophospholipase L1 biosynthesis ATPase subunit